MVFATRVRSSHPAGLIPRFRVFQWNFRLKFCSSIKWVIFAKNLIFGDDVGSGKHFRILLKYNFQKNFW